jgi:hypothetical protein
MQRNVRPVHYCIHGEGEILPAFLLGAPEHTGLLGRVGVVDGASLRTDRAIRPQNTF